MGEIQPALVIYGMVFDKIFKLFEKKFKLLSKKVKNFGKNQKRFYGQCHNDVTLYAP